MAFLRERRSIANKQLIAQERQRFRWRELRAVMRRGGRVGERARTGRAARLLESVPLLPAFDQVVDELHLAQGRR